MTKGRRLLNGPLEGGVVSERHQDEYIFVAAGANGARVFKLPGDRFLYRRLPDGDYTYADYTHAPCEDCGGVLLVDVVDRPDGCSFCGGELRRVPVPALR